MSFFSQVIVPRLCDFLLNKSLLARHQRELLDSACGDVLESGFGTGLNLPYYPGGSPQGYGGRSEPRNAPRRSWSSVRFFDLARQQTLAWLGR